MPSLQLFRTEYKKFWQDTKDQKHCLPDTDIFYEKEPVKRLSFVSANVYL